MSVWDKTTVGALMQQSIVERQFRCLIYTDSRGRGLHQCVAGTRLNSYLFDCKGKINTEVILRKGATLEHAIQYINDNGVGQTQDIIIVAVGICNLTERQWSRNIRTLSYSNRDRKAETISKIQHLLDTYGEKLHIATIAPASFNNYFKHHNNTKPSDEQVKTFHTQQQHLLEDCEEINKYIIDRNIERNQPTLEWAKQCFVQSKKRHIKSKKIKNIVRKKLAVKLLPDGVHPSDNLRATWHKLTEKFITQIVKQSLPKEDTAEDTSGGATETEEDDLNTSQSTEEEEVYFKRKRRS